MALRYYRSSALAACFFIASTAFSAPVRAPQKRQGQIVRLPNSPDIDNSDIVYATVGPVGSSGDVYGGRQLLGSEGVSSSVAPIGPNVPLPTGDSEQYVGKYELVQGRDGDAGLGIYLDTTNSQNPQPIRGGNGATDPGPRNKEIYRQNSELLSRPDTDHGDLPNAKWPMSLSSARSGTGGDNPELARQDNVDEVSPVQTIK